MSKRQDLLDAYPGSEDDMLFLEPEYFDEAILGIAQRAGGLFAVCYSEPKIIEILMREDGMDADEAVEHYSFNVLGSYVGESSPVFLDEGVISK